MKKIMICLMLGIVGLFTVACGDDMKSDSQSYTEETTEPFSKFTWPTSDIAKLLPVPKSDIGRIEWEASYGFVIYVGNTPKNDYDKYVDACKEKGFTVDYQAGKDSDGKGFYYAENEDGYHLYLNQENEDTMFIRIDEPKDDDESDSTEPESTESTTAETQSDSSEVIADENGVSADFKETMDSYEAFFDEYCEFMKKYKESNDTVSMLSDYNDYMSKYADMMNKMSELKDDDLSAEELIYYTEVNTRISKKLAEVAQ